MSVRLDDESNGHIVPPFDLYLATFRSHCPSGVRGRNFLPTYQMLGRSEFIYKTSGNLCLQGTARQLEVTCTARQLEVQLEVTCKARQGNWNSKSNSYFAPRRDSNYADPMKRRGGTWFEPLLSMAVLRDSLLLLLPSCFYIAKCNKRECCCIWLSGPGFQDLGFRTSIFGSQDLGFKTSINGHWVSAPRQTHATSEIIYKIVGTRCIMHLSSSPPCWPSPAPSQTVEIRESSD
jgi:hypothetical protein